MIISTSPYVLTYQPSLNMTREGRRGTLLKVVFDHGGVGYADCHPWTELGDESLDIQIASLRDGKPTRLMRCALECARFDAQGKIDPLSTLRSHLLGLHVDGLANRSAEDFTHVKFKVGNDPQKEIRALESLCASTSFQLRLDFNGCLTFASFRTYAATLQPFQERIDFIEDPFPYDEDKWSFIQSQGWTLACDREASLAFGKPEAAKVLIIKPAILAQEEIFAPADGQIKLVTSYLGHPQEQLYAASIASRLDPEAKCIHGLQSHRVYEPNRFSRCLNWKGSCFESSSFKEHLEALEWQPIGECEW